MQRETLSRVQCEYGISLYLSQLTAVFVVGDCTRGLLVQELPTRETVGAVSAEVVATRASVAKAFVSILDSVRSQKVIL